MSQHERATVSPLPTDEEIERAIRHARTMRSEAFAGAGAWLIARIRGGLGRMLAPLRAAQPDAPTTAVAQPTARP